MSRTIQFELTYACQHRSIFLELIDSQPLSVQLDVVPSLYLASTLINDKLFAYITMYIMSLDSDLIKSLIFVKYPDGSFGFYVKSDCLKYFLIFYYDLKFIKFTSSGKQPLSNTAVKISSKRFLSIDSLPVMKLWR